MWGKKNKYVLTGETRKFEGVTLHRIKAAKTFGPIVKGTLGGWVEGEHNLSHRGSCWLSDNAVCMGNAEVKRDASVSGEAVVKENAIVGHSTIVSGHAVVDGNARVFGGYIEDLARVTDNARVSGNVIVSDTAEVGGDAIVKGRVKVMDAAYVCGSSEVIGNTVVQDYACINGDISVSTGGTFGGTAIVESYDDFFALDFGWVKIVMFCTKNGYNASVNGVVGTSSKSWVHLFNDVVDIWEVGEKDASTVRSLVLDVAHYRFG